MIISWLLFGSVFFVTAFSFTGTNNSQTIGESRGTSSLLPYQFHPLTAIHTFICSLATEMSSLHFYSLWRNYQCATQFIPRWKLKLGSIIIAFYLAFFTLSLAQVISHRQEIALSSHRLSPQYFKRNAWHSELSFRVAGIFWKYIRTQKAAASQEP